MTQDTHWHLLMTKPREDARAEQHLRNQGYDIFRPLLRHYKLQKGRQTAVTESLFPRYIFIRLHEEFSNWSAIRSTRGVAGLVRFNDYPTIVPNELVESLLSQVDKSNTLDKTLTEKTLFKAGDRVRIDGGSFNGLEAIVQAQTSEERVIILLDLLGKSHPLAIPVGQLSAL